MKKQKFSYDVYRNGRYIGSTYAVSKAQAINNVRHNECGDYVSQYDDHWEAILAYLNFERGKSK